ncbi:hypothetical protein EVAR_85737_1 [Eumeta japonica]|uniref:Uncharacterized protein n=1 Tax=Eumeta variegata TaxID=151549 RepID=A0A4C1TNM1_EUMVA|nr:hypothetical protein EVAR_85737_1 [Eumeta japonica]
MRSLQLISEFPNASFHFALESSLDLYSGVGCARAAQLRFALINSRISGGNFRRSEDAGTSRSLSSTTVLTWLVEHLWQMGSPSYVFTIEITEGMTASPKAKRLLGRAGQPFWRREIDRDYDECTMARHSESTTRGFHIVMVSDENHEFLFDVTARSEIGRMKSRALNGAKDGHHRLDVVSKRCGAAVAEAGATRVARGGQLLQTVPGGPRWQRGLWFTGVGDGARRQPGSWFVSQMGKLIISRGGATVLLGLLGLGLL